MIKGDISSPRRYITFIQDITRVSPPLFRRFHSHLAIIARRDREGVQRGAEKSEEIAFYSAECCEVDIVAS